MIKAFLVGISEYFIENTENLPYCKNDIFQLRKSLIKGLKANEKNITLIGCDNTVIFAYFDYMFDSFLSSLTEDDTMIFYFSGHGTNGNILLSDKEISINSIIERIQNSKSKSKIIILDCCHSGDFILDGVAQLSTDDSIAEFVGTGCTIMASCTASQESGFHPKQNISLYTSFLCDAIEDRFIIKKGKKSLEDINKLIRLYNKVWNERKGVRLQEPIFRSNMGGTVFFDVGEYEPYIMNKIIENTDEYIITAVKPMHTVSAKRYAVMVLLKHPCTYSMIANIANEIIYKAKYYEVYDNNNFENYYRSQPANIIWCYFGYDEEDMVNRNYYCHTTWVDNTQDKSYWYKEKNNSILINDILIDLHSDYHLIKNLNSCTLSKEEFVKKTKECTSQLISVAEKYIQLFREFNNHTFSEEAFISLVQPLNNLFFKWYFIQSDLPVAPIDLHDWAEANIQLANTIYDLSLFYNKNNLNKWSSDNRHWLVQNTIERYEDDLERLKSFKALSF